MGTQVVYQKQKNPAGQAIADDFDSTGGAAYVADEPTINTLDATTLKVPMLRGSLATRIVYELESLTTNGGQFTNAQWNVFLVPAGAGTWTSIDYVATSNVTLSGSQTVDGATVANGKVVLAARQTATTDNGLWTVNTGGAWTRTTGATSGTNFVAGKSVLVNSGGAYAGTTWVCTVSTPTVGTSPIYFERAASLVPVLASSGGAPTPTGTGFTHVTSGAQDSAARAVNLATSDVTGTLGVGNGGTGLASAGTSGTLLKSTGTGFSNTVAGNLPFIGTGFTAESPDGTSSSMTEDCTNAITLSSDGNTTIYTTAAIPSGYSMNVDVEVTMKKVGSAVVTSRATWRRTIFVVNNAGTVTNPASATTDVDLTPAGWIGSDLSSATASLTVSGTSVIVQVARPTGVACEVSARIDIRAKYLGT